MASESAQADPLREELEALRATLRAEIDALRARERQLDAELQRLVDRARLTEREMRALRGAGPARPVPQRDASASASQRATRSSRAAGGTRVEVAQAEERTARPATSEPGPAPSERSAPVSGPSASDQQAQRALESALPLSSGTPGVLTPRGQVTLVPSLAYEYTPQNQFGVNGFQIIPGITFGNIFVNRVETNTLTAALTARYGVTDRLELNLRVPYVYSSVTTTSTIPVGTNPQQLSTEANNTSTGDIQFGASYQINRGEDDWPIFLANLAFKTATGVSPYDVPIFTANDPNGGFLRGVPRRAPTGTGFYALSPSLTVIYPTAPGTLFANVLYTYNFGRTVQIRDPDGGPSSSLDLRPGSLVSGTVGIGFALNERASLSLGYTQAHVFEATRAGRSIPGSAYSFGSFNFGIGYELSERLRLNANIAIGVGPNAPAARVLIELPYRFSL